MSWREITHLDDLKKSEEPWRMMFDGEFDNYKLYKRFIKKDGSILYIQLATSCYRNKDGVIQWNCRGAVERNIIISSARINHYHEDVRAVV